MREVVLRFGSRADAYGYVSESRRLAQSLLWEIKVSKADDGWIVRLPEAVFRTSVADSLGRFRGEVVSPRDGGG
jgi:hypothetical protein